MNIVAKFKNKTLQVGCCNLTPTRNYIETLTLEESYTFLTLSAAFSFDFLFGSDETGSSGGFFDRP